MAEPPAATPTDSTSSDDDSGKDEATEEVAPDAESLSAYVSALSQGEKEVLYQMLRKDMEGEEKPMSMKDIEGVE